MKIDEAIKVLSEIEYVDPVTHRKQVEALKLGIEALKRVKADRTGYETYAPDLLPGETGD